MWVNTQYQKAKKTTRRSAKKTTKKSMNQQLLSLHTPAFSFTHSKCYVRFAAQLHIVVLTDLPSTVFYLRPGWKKNLKSFNIWHLPLIFSLVGPIIGKLVFFRSTLKNEKVHVTYLNGKQSYTSFPKLFLTDRNFCFAFLVWVSDFLFWPVLFFCCFLGFFFKQKTCCGLYV